MKIRIPTEKSQAHWKQRGAAMLTQLMIKYLKIAYSISVLNVFESGGIPGIQYLLLNA